jgi:hypothetical protein|tara:strand:+ start:127 stop:477 length:351 start_codon:yes stop_codon:yes gene_type:complete
LSSELKTKWNNLKTKLSVDFSENEIIDIDSIIFLIGLQELGQFQKRFNKQKKLEVIHIAVCKLLSDYGYYEFDHTDNDGWPHYKLIKKLPNLKAGEQTILMKKAIINYFVKSNYIN